MRTLIVVCPLAITVAAHEVGHAMQHESGYWLFKLRHKLVHIAFITEKLGSMALVAMPFIALLTRSPAAGGILLLLGFLGIAFLSTVGGLLSLVIFIGCFFVLGSQKQAIHDMISKTAVFNKADLR